jgi:two-component system chemotaxis sensor kinase CheA
VFAGATILGDGRVALILDVSGVRRRAGLTAGAEEAEPPPAARPAPIEELLIVKLGDGHPAAVQTSRVSRIEVLEGQAIESATNRPAVQWRGRVLPIVPLAAALGRPSGPIEAGRTYHVLVHTRGAGPLGFLVDEIEDIVSTTTELAGDGGPVRGRAVVGGRITDLLDLDAIAAARAKAA